MAVWKKHNQPSCIFFSVFPPSHPSSCSFPAPWSLPTRPHCSFLFFPSRSVHQRLAKILGFFSFLGNTFVSSGRLGFCYLPLHSIELFLWRRKKSHVFPLFHHLLLLLLLLLFFPVGSWAISISVSCLFTIWYDLGIWSFIALSWRAHFLSLFFSICYFLHFSYYYFFKVLVWSGSWHGFWIWGMHGKENSAWQWHWQWQWGTTRAINKAFYIYYNGVWHICTPLFNFFFLFMGLCSSVSSGCGYVSVFMSVVWSVILVIWGMSSPYNWGNSWLVRVVMR